MTIVVCNIPIIVLIAFLITLLLLGYHGTSIMTNLNCPKPI